MFWETKRSRFLFSRTIRPNTPIYRNISSAAFSKVMSVPFTTDKSTALELFRKHHAKNLLLQQPVTASPEPIPIYLPYYIFSATANLTYSARLSKTTYELRYDLFGGRWRYYPRTRIHEIPRQTLSDKEYHADHVPLHIYAGYDQPASWLKFDTSKILSVSSNRPLYSISGIVPRVEEFSRSYKAVEDQVMKYIVDAEQERARKYLQRTYDPERIDFTYAHCQASVIAKQVYLPVWKFEFPFGNANEIYSTYVSGWSTATSGPVFYHPELSGAVAGVLGALASLTMLWPWSLFAATDVGASVFVLVRQFLSGLPRSQRSRAWGEMTQQRIQDEATEKQSTRQEYTFEWEYTGQARQQRQQQQQQQHNVKNNINALPKHSRNTLLVTLRDSTKPSKFPPLHQTPKCATHFAVWRENIILTWSKVAPLKRTPPKRSFKPFRRLTMSLKIHENAKSMILMGLRARQTEIS